MIAYSIGILLILLGLISLSLQRFYSSTPVYELKRLAARGDPRAAALYKVAAYGAAARLVLWALAVFALAGGMGLIVIHAPLAVTLAVLVVVMTLALIVAPSLALTALTAGFAAACSGPLVWLLMRLHPFTDRIARQTGRFRSLEKHTRLYDKDDLVRLLQRQKEQADNRIAHEELELAERALAFSDKQAASVLEPASKLYMVNAHDTIGPILLDQLHQQHQQAFLVYEDEKSHIIGQLFMRDAIAAKQGGTVASLVRNDLTYIQEEAGLREVLATFEQSGQQLLVVRNTFDELVGVVSASRVLHELLGEPSADSAAQPTVNDAADESPAEASSPEATEVVE